MKLLSGKIFYEDFFAFSDGGSTSINTAKILLALFLYM